MCKNVTASILLAMSVAAAAAQSTSPQSRDNRPDITSQTHCRDKDGNIWLHSSAQLAGSTDRAASTEGNTATSADSSFRPPASVAPSGHSDMAEAARSLPDCP
jgi:hypothetical protein